MISEPQTYYLLFYYYLLVSFLNNRIYRVYDTVIPT